MNDRLKSSPNLMISVSGIRGTIPAGLTPDVITAAGLGFASVTGRKIVIGWDSRDSRPMIQDILQGVMIACGKEVLIAGLAPTPTVKAAVQIQRAHGAIMISASHNPTEWNGLKLIGPQGFFFGKEQLQGLLDSVKANRFTLADHNKLGTIKETQAIDAHIKSVIRIIKNVESVRAKKYRVVVDAVGGAGREALPQLLSELGCEVIRLYCDPPRPNNFPREPEPTPANLTDFSKLLKKEKAAVGFALDPDADRLVPGGPKSGAINEEYSLPLAFLGLSEIPPIEKSGKVRGRHSLCVNLSTSTLLDQVAQSRGFIVLRSAVGEANVVDVMRRKDCIFGGEGNGGIIHSGVPSFGRDSLLGAALILAAMAKNECESVEDLMSKLPRLYMEKRKFAVKAGADPRDIFTKIENALPGMSADRRDGLHLSNSDGWVHARASNTEPIIRIIAEGRTQNALNELLQRASKNA